MPTKTANYGLTKPEASDYYDIKDMNDNNDMIDGLIRQTNLIIEALSIELNELKAQRKLLCESAEGVAKGYLMCDTMLDEYNAYEIVCKDSVMIGKRIETPQGYGVVAGATYLYPTDLNIEVSCHVAMDVYSTHFFVQDCRVQKPDGTRVEDGLVKAIYGLKI